MITVSKHIEIDCQSYADVARQQGVIVEQVCETDAELLTLLMQLQDGGLTQGQTARLLGMSQPGVNRVLSGKSNLSSTGRAFVLYLLQEVKVNAATPHPAGGGMGENTLPAGEGD